MTATQQEISRTAGAAAARRMDGAVRVLAWPVAALLVTGMVHITIEAIWPDLRTFFVPSALAPLLLAYGIWAGYRVTRAGGSAVTAAIAGLALGVLPLALDVVGFGILLDRGVQNGLLAGMFGMAMILFGALIGAGFVLGEPAGSGR